jgi:hypothetical protein
MRSAWRHFEEFKMSSVTGFPLVGQLPGQLADGQGWQVDQQLREIELWIHVVSAAGAGQAGRGAAVRPPRGLPTKSEFFRFSTTRFIFELSLQPAQRLSIFVKQFEDD